MGKKLGLSKNQNVPTGWRVTAYLVIRSVGIYTTQQQKDPSQSSQRKSLRCFFLGGPGARVPGAGESFLGAGRRGLGDGNKQEEQDNGDGCSSGEAEQVIQRHLQDVEGQTIINWPKAGEAA